MCMVSMVIDSGRRQWPQFDPPPFHPGPQIFPAPLTDKERQELEELRAWKRLLDAAKIFDKKTGQPDCEDPQKVPFLEGIIRRLEALETAAKKKPLRKSTRK